MTHVYYPIEELPRANVWVIGTQNGYEYRSIVERKPDWNFYFFEADFTAYMQLHQWVGNYKNAFAYCYAVTRGNERHVEFYRPLVDPSCHPAWAWGVGGLTPDVANKHRIPVEPVLTPAIHWRKISNITQSAPNCLITDMEGHDNIMFGAVRKYKPASYQYEYKHLNHIQLTYWEQELVKIGYKKYFEDNLNRRWVLSNPNV